MGRGVSSRRLHRVSNSLAVLIAAVMVAGIAGAVTVSNRDGAAAAPASRTFAPYPVASPVPAGLPIYPAAPPPASTPWLLPGAGDTVVSARVIPANQVAPVYEQVYGDAGAHGLVAVETADLGDTQPVVSDDCGRPGIFQKPIFLAPFSPTGSTVDGQPACDGPDFMGVFDITWRFRDGVYGGLLGDRFYVDRFAATARQPSGSVLGVDVSASARHGLTLEAEGPVGTVGMTMLFRRGGCFYRLTTGTGSPDGTSQSNALNGAAVTVPHHVAGTIETAALAHPDTATAVVQNESASWTPETGAFARLAPGPGLETRACFTGQEPVSTLRLRPVTEATWRAALTSRGIGVH